MAGRYRKELKYVINEAVYLRIERLLSQVMQPDENCSDGSYMVRSQYFDSLMDSDLQDNIDGVYEKRKIRVRIYSTDSDTAKLEYKCKNGADGIKYSITLNKDEVLMMEQGRYEFLLERDENLAKELYIRLVQGAYSPKTIIEYKRLAYVYPVSDVRITFDRNLRGTVNPYGIYEKEPMYYPLLAPDKGVLEIKYNDFFPAELKELLVNLKDTPEAFSKYSISRLSYL